MSLVWDDTARGAEWRTTVTGQGWHAVHAADDNERVVYSGPCEADAQALSDYEQRRVAGA